MPSISITSKISQKEISIDLTFTSPAIYSWKLTEYEVYHPFSFSCVSFVVNLTRQGGGIREGSHDQSNSCLICVSLITRSNQWMIHSWLIHPPSLKKIIFPEIINTFSFKVILKQPERLLYDINQKFPPQRIPPGTSFRASWLIIAHLTPRFTLTHTHDVKFHLKTYTRYLVMLFFFLDFILKNGVFCFKFIYLNS